MSGSSSAFMGAVPFVDEVGDDVRLGQKGVMACGSVPPVAGYCGALAGSVQDSCIARQTRKQRLSCTGDGVLPLAAAAEAAA
ncbi:hypothetical protein [Nonomuraea helvata]|uniref:Uncharacterized protein n=1 Tax=Nonomuraea helvata TaxID=37484 RepID=A0ABV5SHS3_9ACTN